MKGNFASFNGSRGKTCGESTRTLTHRGGARGDSATVRVCLLAANDCATQPPLFISP